MIGEEAFASLFRFTTHIFKAKSNGGDVLTRVSERVMERDGKIEQKDMMRFYCHFVACLLSFF